MIESDTKFYYKAIIHVIIHSATGEIWGTESRGVCPLKITEFM